MQQGNTQAPHSQAALLALLVFAALCADGLMNRGSVGRGSGDGLSLGLAPRASLTARGGEGPPPEGLGPRELRHLPGIGERRALQIAEERWRRGGHFPLARWHELRGIGPVTQAEVAEDLRRRGIRAAARDPSPALLHSPR